MKKRSSFVVDFFEIRYIFKLINKNNFNKFI